MPARVMRGSGVSADVIERENFCTFSKGDAANAGESDFARLGERDGPNRETAEERQSCLSGISNEHMPNKSATELHITQL